MKSDHDIVTRLRAVLHNDRSVELMNREAADEIERLREELTASHESHGNEAGALTERLSLAIHERDEARREVCVAEAMLSPRDDKTPRMEAAERGWDCFKEKP